MTCQKHIHTEQSFPIIDPETGEVICYHDTNQIYEDVNHSFGFTRASFQVLPRVLMEAMPKDWQDRYCKLLQEFEEAFPDAPDYKYALSARDDKGRFVKIDRRLCQYRRPDFEALDEWRGKDPK